MSERDLLDAPCAFCGYNRNGYWQEGTHPPGCPWHGIGGKVERELAVRDVVARLAARVAELEAREKKLREKILRVRDWLKYEANADGGICSEIDAAARAEVDKP